jgi:hypothetical protein
MFWLVEKCWRTIEDYMGDFMALKAAVIFAIILAYSAVSSYTDLLVYWE